jgi:hypothetical protein
MHGAAKGRIWFPTVFVRLNGRFGEKRCVVAILVLRARGNSASAKREKPMTALSRTVSVHALCSEGQVFPNLR